MTYAPVIIPTLCRFEHFKRCVESLSRCTHADKTELIIGLDYPLKESHREGYSKILNYVDNGIIGFKTVTIIKQNMNQGALQNFNIILTYAFNLYKKLIISEDDNEFSPNFLDYINRGLILFEDAEEISAICGYNYPVEMNDYTHNTYLSRNFSAWGYGIWKQKYEKYQSGFSLQWSQKILKSPTFMLKILRQKPSLAISLWYMCRHKTMLGDVNRELYNIIDNHYSLFPRVSLVRNWGHDGTGENCADFHNERYLTQEIDDRAVFDFSEDINILPRKFNKRLRVFFGDRFSDLFLRTCRYIKRRIFN